MECGESKAIVKLVEQYIHKVLKDISLQHNLDYNELVDKYIKGTHEPEESIQMYEYEYNDVLYFIDKKMNIYTHEEHNPKLIGIKLVDGSVKFYDESDY
jgi:hypothetical protein